MSLSTPSNHCVGQASSQTKRQIILKLSYNQMLFASLVVVASAVAGNPRSRSGFDFGWRFQLGSAADCAVPSAPYGSIDGVQCLGLEQVLNCCTTSNR